MKQIQDMKKYASTDLVSMNHITSNLKVIDGEHFGTYAYLHSGVIMKDPLSYESIKLKSVNGGASLALCKISYNKIHGGTKV